MTTTIQNIEAKYIKKVPALRPGDTVRVHQKIKEGNKERIQVFEGVVLRVKNGGLKSTFLVRKISFGVGIEKNFLLYSPNIAKIEIKKRAKVRQAYLTYLRKLTGKSARLRDKGFDALAVNVKDEPEEIVAEPVRSEDGSGGDQNNAIPVSDEEKTDAEITELDAEEIEEPTDDVPLDEEIKAENKEAQEEGGSQIDDEPEEENTGEQEETVEAIEQGLDKADMDLEKGKAAEGERAEKNVEADTQADLKEEVDQERDSRVD